MPNVIAIASLHGFFATITAVTPGNRICLFSFRNGHSTLVIVNAIADDTVVLHVFPVKAFFLAAIAPFLSETAETIRHWFAPAHFAPPRNEERPPIQDRIVFH
jgi:hypothetical protein